RRPLSSRGILLVFSALAALFFCGSVRAQTPYLDDCRTRALAAEKRGDWVEACNCYDEILRKDRTQIDARDGYQRCLRRFHLAPSYRAAVSQLSPSDGLDVLVQVLGTIPLVYVDRQRTDLPSLFQAGLQELRFALEDEAFLREYLPGASAAAVADFQSR